MIKDGCCTTWKQKMLTTVLAEKLTVKNECPLWIQQ
jgi:hypothetical protein